MEKRCNYCTMQDLRLMAEQRGMDVSTRRHPIPGFPDGVDTYVHPPTEPPPAAASTLDEPESDGESSWWAAWFAELPVRCAC